MTYHFTLLLRNKSYIGQMARGQGSFGLSSRGTRGRNSNSSFRGNFRGRGRGRTRGGTAGVGRGRGSERNNAAPAREDDGTQLAERFERVSLNNEVDEKLGFAKIDQGPRREGWLINMHTVSFLSMLKCHTHIKGRPSLRILIGLVERQQLTSISYKTTVGCSNAHSNMSHIFILGAR